MVTKNAVFMRSVAFRKRLSIKNICEDLNCGTQKACKLLDELEKVGALERKRQGLGRPNKLYLKKMF